MLPVNLQQLGRQSARGGNLDKIRIRIRRVGQTEGNGDDDADISAHSLNAL